MFMVGDEQVTYNATKIEKLLVIENQLMFKWISISMQHFVFINYSVYLKLAATN